MIEIHQTGVLLLGDLDWYGSQVRMHKARRPGCQSQEMLVGADHDDCPVQRWQQDVGIRLVAKQPPVDTDSDVIHFTVVDRCNRNSVLTPRDSDSDCGALGRSHGSSFQRGDTNIMAYIYKNSNIPYTGSNEENSNCDSFS